MNFRNWKQTLAVTLSIAFVAAVISFIPSKAFSQIDLNTRVLNLENFAFGGAKTNTVVPVTNATAILQSGSSSTNPQLSGIGTTVLSYTAGTLNLGGSPKPILAGGISSLDASQSSCAAPAFSSCDIIYWTSSTALVKSTSIATAYGAGANIILAYVTTDSSSNVLTITMTSQSGVKVDSIIPGTINQVPFYSATNVLSGVAGWLFDGTSKTTLGVAGTSVGSVVLNNATSGSITLQPPTGALGTSVVTLPAQTGGVMAAYSCGTVAAAGACANTATGGTAHAIFGIATLASNTSTITGISPAFTSSSTFYCVANDITTRGNPVQAIPASATTVAFTNTTGATDNISFGCFGY